MKYIEKDLESSIIFDAHTRLEASKTYNSDPKVRDHLRTIYHGCCAYCESKFEEGAYFQIDHFYPKGNKQYKPYEKEIRNLHYSCQRCNNLKGDSCKRIMSPNWFLSGNDWKLTKKDKIEREIYYVGHLLYSNNTQGTIDRGKKTIELFNLNNANPSPRSNRASLVEGRLRVLNDMYLTLKAMTNLLVNYDYSNNITIEILIYQAIIKTRPDAPYSTMIIHNYGDLLVKLLKIYLFKRDGVRIRM